jgi:hypothetical protein
VKGRGGGGGERERVVFDKINVRLLKYFKKAFFLEFS